jgi:hypothetical protein
MELGLVTLKINNQHTPATPQQIYICFELLLHPREQHCNRSCSNKHTHTKKTVTQGPSHCEIQVTVDSDNVCVGVCVYYCRTYYKAVGHRCVTVYYRDCRTYYKAVRGGGGGVCVCVYYCRTYYKAVRGGGRRRVDDMCYDRRRAKACVVGPVRNPVLLHRVRLFSLESGRHAMIDGQTDETF